MKKLLSADVGNFAPEIVNVALDMSLEWGEHWLVPINERILKVYPELTAEEADDLNRWCVEVRNYAFTLIERDYPVVMNGGQGAAMEQVRQKYPLIDAENLARLYNQGMYYAWHG